jgi:formylglycine-generating enzyme required for sulfatase activity
VVGGVAVVLIAAFLVWLAYGKIEDQKHFEQLLASARAHLGEKKNDEAVLDLDEADKVRPQDDQVKQLLDQVRQQRESAALAEAYQAAMKNGRGALERDDYKGTMAEADKALSLKADDAAAKQLRAEAQTKLDAANQKEAAYQSAIKDARGALEREDYQGALAQADMALLLKPDDADAKQLRDGAQQKLSGVHPQSFTNSIQMEFVWVPGVGGGGAYIGKYEVTEQQFQMIHGKLPNGQPLADANLPVAGVTFQEATEFCEALSKRENKHYTLPTRQQWLTATGLSEDKVADAWNILRASGALEHEATSLNRHPARTKPVAVGSMGASTNGVCDMFGNVREWVRENQRAGFSYQSSGVGRTGEMFLPGSETDARIAQETGLRCLLLESRLP